MDLSYWTLGWIGWTGLLSVGLAACAVTDGRGGEEADDEYRRQRETMVATQIAARGVADERVLAAMRSVPRHLFVPADRRVHAYRDTPLAIGSPRRPERRTRPTRPRARRTAPSSTA